MIGGLLLLGGVTYAAVKYKRDTGKFDFEGFLAKYSKKKKSTVFADDPIKQKEDEFMKDRLEYGYGGDGVPDWMPEK